MDVLNILERKYPAAETRIVNFEPDELWIKICYRNPFLRLQRRKRFTNIPTPLLSPFWKEEYFRQTDDQIFRHMADSAYLIDNRCADRFHRGPDREDCKIRARTRYCDRMADHIGRTLRDPTKKLNEWGTPLGWTIFADELVPFTRLTLADSGLSRLLYSFITELSRNQTDITVAREIQQENGKGAIRDILRKYR